MGAKRKVAGVVLAGSLAVFSAAAMLREDEPVRVITWGPEYLAPAASDPSIITTTTSAP